MSPALLQGLLRAEEAVGVPAQEIAAWELVRGTGCLAIPMEEEGLLFFCRKPCLSRVIAVPGG